MKKLLLLTVVLKCIVCQDLSAQLLKKLKEKVQKTADVSENANNTQTEGEVAEEKVKNIGYSFTIKSNYGDVKYDIDKSAEMIAENKSADGKTQYFLTTTKKQYVLHGITTLDNGTVTKMEKTIVNKNQSIYCANTTKYVEGQYEVTLFLESSATKKRMTQGDNVENNISDIKFILKTNTVEKANELISTILGKDIKGSQLNRFVYVTGDGKVIKTSASPFWSLRDGQLYFESLPNEKALRVTYFEINVDASERQGTYLVKVTTIPSDAIGDYKKFSFEEKDFYMPLKKSVTKIIYDKQTSPTSETITDRFRLASNDYGSVVTNAYCNIASQQLAPDVREKFKKEVQQPIVAKREAEEIEREKLWAASKANSNASSTGNSGSASASKSTNNLKKEFYVKLRNTSKEKVKIEVKTAKSMHGLQTELQSRSSRSFKVEIGGRIFVNGNLVYTISAGMEDQEIIVAQ